MSPSNQRGGQGLNGTIFAAGGLGETAPLRELHRALKSRLDYGVGEAPGSGHFRASNRDLRGHDCRELRGAGFRLQVCSPSHGGIEGTSTGRGEAESLD